MHPLEYIPPGIGLAGLAVWLYIGWKTILQPRLKSRRLAREFVARQKAKEAWAGSVIVGDVLVEGGREYEVVEFDGALAVRVNGSYSFVKPEWADFFKIKERAGPW